MNPHWSIVNFRSEKPFIVETSFKMINQFDQFDSNESLKNEPEKPFSQFSSSSTLALTSSSLSFESSAESIINSFDALRKEVRRESKNATKKKYSVAIDIYTMRMIRRYQAKNITDYEFWKIMNVEFENYIEQIWFCILPAHWTKIKKICVSRGLWIDNHDFF